MKTWVYLIAVILASVLPFCFYISYHDFSSLSNAQIDWGSFGSFMGGTSGPMIAATTLLFLIHSFFKQSKNSSIKALLDLCQSHTVFVSNFETQYSQGYSGLKYLDWIWDRLSSNLKDKITDKLIIKYAKINCPEIIPIISNFKIVVKFIENEISFSQSDKRDYIHVFFSQRTAVELKLIFAEAYLDDDLKALLSRNPMIFNLDFCERDGEEEIIKHMKKQLKA